jgi:hypothetical protein
MSEHQGDYQHLTVTEQRDFLTRRAHDLEAAHWRSTVAAAEAAADPAAPLDAIEGHHADMWSIQQRLTTVAKLADQLRPTVED